MRLCGVSTPNVQMGQASQRQGALPVLICGCSIWNFKVPQWFVFLIVSFSGFKLQNTPLGEVLHCEQHSSFSALQVVALFCAWLSRRLVGTR